MTRRPTPAPRSGVLEAGLRRAGDAGGVASAMSDYTTSAPLGIPQSCCPRCRHDGPHRGGHGTPPHQARLVCGQRGRWLRWLPKPHPVTQDRRP